MFVKLKYLLKSSLRGIQVQKEDLSDSGDIPYITMGDLNNNYITKPTGYLKKDIYLKKYFNYPLFSPDSLIIGLIRHVGKNGMLKVSFLTNANCCILKCNDLLLVKYLQYYFTCCYTTNYFHLFLHGSVFPETNVETIKSLIVPISSLATQQKVIHFLDQQCSLIQQLLLKIDLLLIKLGEYQEAFISEQVFKYSSTCNSIKLKYVFRVCNGATPSTSNPIFWNGAYLFITPTDLTMDQMYLSTSSKKLTSAVFQNPSSRLMPPYSLVISCRGSIGKLNILPVEYFFSQSCEGLILLNPLDHNLKYYYYYLKIHQEYFQKIGFGSTFLAITGDTLKNFFCCHLSKTQQDEIVSSLDSKMTLLTKLQSHYTSLKVHLEEYQESLLYETFQHLS